MLTRLNLYRTIWLPLDSVHRLARGSFTKDHNVSETGSVSVLRWVGQDIHTQLSPSERASLNHWTSSFWRAQLSRTTLHHPPEDGDRSSLHRKHRFLYCCMLIHCCIIVFTARLRSNARGTDHRKHRASIVACVHFCGNMFTEPLPSNELSGFRVSCHNIKALPYFSGTVHWRVGSLAIDRCC
jgi:hypothetical protein